MCQYEWIKIIKIKLMKNLKFKMYDMKEDITGIPFKDIMVFVHLSSLRSPQTYM